MRKERPKMGASWSWRIVAATLLFMAGALAPAGGAAPGHGLPCAIPVDVPGQGLSCRLEHGWAVAVGGGDVVLTHGPDPASLAEGAAALRRGLSSADAEDASAPRAATLPGLAASGPACVPPTEPHHRVLYAAPPGGTARAAAMIPVLRAIAHEANAILHEEGRRLGRPVDYRMLCDANGLARVDALQLPTPAAQASFATIVRDLKAQGFSSSLAKYWVFYDGSVGNYAGQGSINWDDSPSASNANNVGPDYAISYGVLTARLFMHENGHNLGAVQLSAPHSTGAWHCNDGADVMCYDDGGPRSDYREACPGPDAYDCGHDDYFHPFPPPGSYLATHWNLGSPVNRWLAFSAPG